MQIKVLLTSLLFPIFMFAQNCVYVDSVYNTAKLRELGNRDIRFGVKQIVEDEVAQKILQELALRLEIEKYKLNF